MNRTERDSFTATTDQNDLAYGESACLETPPDLFAALHEEFKFDIDLTANEQNHLLPLWFGPKSPTTVGSNQTSLDESVFRGVPIIYEKGYDALSCPWMLPVYGNQPSLKAGFANPPYGAFVPRILANAVEEQRNGFLSVFLLPARINRTFKDLIVFHAHEVRFVDERVTFYSRFPSFTKLVNDVCDEMQAKGIAPVNDPTPG